MNPYTRNYNAGGAIGANLFCKPGAADTAALVAAASTDSLFGVSTGIPSASGEPVDVIHLGPADLLIGGNVTRGDLLTSNASGKGVAAAPAAGVNARVGAMALASGVDGDIIPVMVIPGQTQG